MQRRLRLQRFLDELTFGTAGWLGGTQYTVEATPKTVTKTETAPMSVVISVTVKDKAGNSATLTVTTVTLAKRTAGESVGVSVGLVPGDSRNDVTEEAEFDLSGTLASNSFAIFAHKANPAIKTATEKDARVIDGLPNLQRFFAKGGTISLVGGSGAAGDPPNKSVVISEIMWGLDLAAEPVNQADHQWIELLNTDNDLSDTDDENAAADAIELSDYKLVFTPGTVLPAPAMLSDQISNIERAGWNVDIGQSGKLGPTTEVFTPVNLVSMYRNINYAHLMAKHGDRNADENRKEQLNAVPNGKAKGSWKESTVNDTYAKNQLGSPDAQHFLGRGSLTPTSVGRANVVITEVGNNGDYDWIELTAIADTNLKDYELQYIKTDGTIGVLAQFANKVLKAGEILLVVRTDPTNQPRHPIATGKAWKDADADRVKTGTQSLYHIDSRLDIADDVGKTLFILRNAKGKTNHANIVDLAGNRYITNTTSAYRTDMWPLQATAAGGGNVIGGDVEDFNDSRVYQRNNRGSGTGDGHWSVGKYTGVGYKRSAASNDRHGGTPGFDNGSVKDKASGLTAGTVTISEIMYATSGNAPQWIELYNSSKSQGINLEGWKLKIENDRDDSDVDIRTPEVDIEFDKVHIPPDQTVLIVSTTSGRNSGHFPSNRIIDLWSTEKKDLEVSDIGRQYQLLSTMGFKLTLTEKGAAATATPADVVGNLGSDWELPMAEEGRSSIIRRYDTGVARDGTMPPPGDGTGAWVLASVSDLSFIQTDTYYGRNDDMGTPGYRGRGALPVSLSKFRPERLDSGEIVVRWITESELNNAGFNILRSETRNGEFTKLNTKLIAGQGTTSERNVYVFPDTSAKPNVVYYYQIQDVSLDGQVQTLRITHLRGNVTAAGKLTTIWGELKALQ